MISPNPARKETNDRAGDLAKLVQLRHTYVRPGPDLLAEAGVPIPVASSYPGVVGNRPLLVATAWSGPMPVMS